MSYILGNRGRVGEVPVGGWFILNDRFFRRVEHLGCLLEPSLLLDARTGMPSLRHQGNILVQCHSGGGLYFAECSDPCSFLEPT